jgi:hypothetical protein
MQRMADHSNDTRKAARDVQARPRFEFCKAI